MAPSKFLLFPALFSFGTVFAIMGQAARILRKEWQRFAVAWATAEPRQQEVQALRLDRPQSLRGAFHLKNLQFIEKGGLCPHPLENAWVIGRLVNLWCALAMSLALSSCGSDYYSAFNSPINYTPGSYSSPDSGYSAPSETHHCTCTKSGCCGSASARRRCHCADATKHKSH